MKNSELETSRAAAKKAEADLETARNRLAVARHEIDLLNACRATLPFDETQIAAHVDKEKSASLKCEIAERLCAAAEAAAADAKAALAKADWQFKHDELAARAEEFIEILKTDYVEHATALAKILSDFQSFHDDSCRFRTSWVRAGSDGEFTVPSPTGVLGLRGLLDLKIPGLHLSQLWPKDRPRPPQLAAVQSPVEEPPVAANS